MKTLKKILLISLFFSAAVLSSMQVMEVGEKARKEGLNNDFYLAGRGHDVEKMKKAILAGADPSQHELKCTCCCYSPLMQVLKADYLKLAELFLKKGVDVDQQVFGSTALMEAVEDGNLKGVLLLVNHNADINKFDEFGWSLLKIAVNKQRNSTSREENQKFTNIIYLLLDKGADLWAVDPNGTAVWKEGSETIKEHMRKRIAKNFVKAVPCLSNEIAVLIAEFCPLKLSREWTQ